jgi:hypothetical protein
MSSKPFLIQLTRQEMSMCKQAAALRWQLARAAGVYNQRNDQVRSDQDIDYLGLRGETAVAKAYDLDYSPAALGIDDGVDMFIAGMSMDVKTSFHSEGVLLFKNPDAVKADLLFMATNTPEEDVMWLLGWTTREYFLANAGPFANDKSLGLSQDKLRRPETLWRLKAQREHGTAA